MKTIEYKIIDKLIFYIKGDEVYPIEFVDEKTKVNFKISECIHKGFYEIFVFENEIRLNLIGTYDEE